MPKVSNVWNWSGTTASAIHSVVGGQTTDSTETLYPVMQRLIKRARKRKSLMPPWWAKHASKQDTGATFSTRKNFYSELGALAHTHWVNKAGNLFVHWDGPVLAKRSDVNINSTEWPVINSNMQAELFAKGATAISRVLPTNPAAGLAVTLGELKAEGLPAMVGAQTLRNRGRDYRDVGGEFLNYEFGWAPLFSDVQSVAQAARDSYKILTQFERDSGKLIRRRYSFPKETSTVITNTGGKVASPPLNTYFYSNSADIGTLECTRVITKSTWFSGCFSYYLSAGDTARTRLKKAEQEAAKLLGLRLTPELFYQLSPWSWLIDWNSNLGDIVHNISAFSNDGLVMRWGYIMSTQTIVDTYRLRNVVLYDGSVPMQQSFGTVQKVRYKATPYGFGLDTGAYSTRQWAILAALGIAKGPRQL